MNTITILAKVTGLDTFENEFTDKITIQSNEGEIDIFPEFKEESENAIYLTLNKEQALIFSSILKTIAEQL